MEDKQTKLIKIISKFNCQSFPLDETAIEVSLEDLEQIGITKCFDVENNCVIDYDNTNDLLIQKQNELRQKRELLLKAFDVYKTNIAYGITTESTDTKTKIITWYHNILNLDEESIITNIPNEIKYYLGGNN